MGNEHPPDEEKEYPQELLDAHYIEDGVAHYPFEDVLVGLEAHLCEQGVFPDYDPEHGPEVDRYATIGAYIRSYTQEELYHELHQQELSIITSGAIHLDPEWKPRTESTYEVVQNITSPESPICQLAVWEKLEDEHDLSIQRLSSETDE